MSKHTAVSEAFAAMITTAVHTAAPLARVRKLDQEDAKPMAPDPAGDVLIRRLDAGDPVEITLSPAAYFWDRPFQLELTAPAQAVLDAMLAAIGAAISANRTLGGLCDYVDGAFPADGVADARGAQPLGWCDVQIVTSYSTTSPFG